MAQRKQGWVIAEQQDGSFDIWHGRRLIMTGMQLEAAALTVVSDNRQPNERVWLADTDDYRTEITRRYRSEDRAKLAEQVASRAPDPNDPHPVRTRYLARYGRPRRHA